jgi:CheY-like chemotaxis protein
VQEHGGEITVRSEPGKGTVFSMNLPVTEEPPAENESTSPLSPGSGTVLLIDDEELIRITAKDLLESLGYTVLIAVNGEAGIKVFSEKMDQVNIIILDMIMPVMGGRETFEKLRVLDPGIPVLLASGFAREEHMAVLKEQGISGFIQKPFRLAELAAKVQEFIKK